ncbi:2575_t:CDS:2, partial [Gigaspora margarita]
DENLISTKTYEMKQRLESIKSQVQRIAATLNEGESVFIEHDQITLQTTTQKRKYDYLSLDLDREEPRDFMHPPEVLGETWNEKLDQKEWSDVSRKKFNSYFPQAKEKAVWRISKRVYQLFSTRGEKYLYVVEHINIMVLEKMYDEDFSDRLLVEARL